MYIRGHVTYPLHYGIHQSAKLVLKWYMQNIGKIDINSPGSTSQKERRKERPLQAARNRWQARLNVETNDQRQAKLEADGDTMA